MIIVNYQNELRYIKSSENKDKAEQIYLDECKHWYNMQTFDKFIKNNKQMLLKDAFDKYRDSTEYREGDNNAYIEFTEFNGGKV